MISNKSYYSFKIFLRFWLVKTTRIIHHNQLMFTNFGKELRHIESMTSKVQPAADYWTDDVKMTSKVQPAANYWTVDRKKLGTRLRYFCWAEKWLRVGLEVWAKKILPSYWMIKTERIPKVDETTSLNFWVLPRGEKHQKSYNCSGVRGRFTKVLSWGEKRGWTGAKLLKVKLIFSFKSLKIFWMNNKAIIEFGFRRIWRILQISEDVIHLGFRPRWITPSSPCRILHILLSLIQ